MLATAQLELDVQTIQPGEVYMLYADVTESWDDWHKEDRGEEYDNCTFGPGRYITHKVRASIYDKLLMGVIVDDCTLDIIKGRMEDYARKWEEKASELNANSTEKPNFSIKVTYVLEKAKRIVIGTK